MTKIYIAGPMESAGGNWNMPLFDYVASELRNHGYEVFNPAEHIRESWGSLDQVKQLSKAEGRLARRVALKDEVTWICDQADLVFMLPGWESSPGATAERYLAIAIGVRTFESGTIVLPTSGAAGTRVDVPALDVPEVID